MKLTHLLSEIVFLSFLVGCATIPSFQALTINPTDSKLVVSSTPTLLTKTPENLVKETFTATLTRQPTSTPTPMVAPSLTPTTPPSISQCTGGDSPNPFPDTIELPGSIVVNDRGQGKSLIGMPLKVSSLPIPETEYIDFFGVSPNGKWLAYSPYPRFQTEPRIESLTIVLLSANGERIEHTLDIIHSFPEFGETEHPNGLPVYWSGKWINDDLLSVQIYYLGAPDTTKALGLQAVIDPFQGIWRNEILADYPFRFDISPDLTRVLYIQSDPTKVMLWNVNQQIQLWSESAFVHAFWAFIQWSPDSEIVVYFKVPFDDEADSHVYLADREGQNIFEITDKIYPVPTFEPVYAQWSPSNCDRLNTQTITYF
jgi:hypothetical protein